MVQLQDFAEAKYKRHENGVVSWKAQRERQVQDPQMLKSLKAILYNMNMGSYQT